ncbi:MAG: nitrate reductase molybdenum cofactor assembly chaperone [Burkholderia gladioli]
MSPARTEARSGDAAYAALSILLDYPDAALLDALPSIEAALATHARVPDAARAGLARFYAYLRERDLLTLQENYVALFDRGRDTSLHLFEHVHGESRDRGQAMVDLMQMYARTGLQLKPGELPDYLPVFLEYLSRLPDGEARALLAETGEILGALAERLAARNSHYGFVFGALLPLAGLGRAERRHAPDATGQPDDDDAPRRPAPADYRALDIAHEEPAVRFVGAGLPGGQPIRFHARRPARHG